MCSTDGVAASDAGVAATESEAAFAGVLGAEGKGATDSLFCASDCVGGTACVGWE